MKEIKKAQAAVAGFEILQGIIEHIAARYPVVVDSACIDVLGVRASHGHEAKFDAAFTAALNHRVCRVTTFDPISKRIAELEVALTRVRVMAQQPRYSDRVGLPMYRRDIVNVCTDALK